MADHKNKAKSATICLQGPFPSTEFKTLSIQKAAQDVFRDCAKNRHHLAVQRIRVEAGTKETNPN